MFAKMQYANFFDNPWVFWKKALSFRRKEYPNLCLIVKLVTCISGSNSAVECCFNILTQVLTDFRLKVQSCKLNNNKYMITSTQITNTESFTFTAVLVFKLLRLNFLFINKNSHTCERGGAHLRISFWNLLMNSKNKLLLKKLLKWANKNKIILTFTMLHFLKKYKEK